MLLALGSDPRVGQWRMSGFRSAELVCLELSLYDFSGSELAGRGFCRPGDALAAGDLLVEDRAGRQFHVLFGSAPESAADVGLRTSEAAWRPAEVHPGPAAFPGNVWILVAPRDRQLRSASLHTTRHEGSAAGDAIDLTLPLTRPSEAVAVP